MFAPIQHNRVHISSIKPVQMNFYLQCLKNGACWDRHKLSVTLYRITSGLEGCLEIMESLQPTELRYILNFGTKLIFL